MSHLLCSAIVNTRQLKLLYRHISNLACKLARCLASLGSMVAQQSPFILVGARNIVPTRDVLQRDALGSRQYAASSLIVCFRDGDTSVGKLHGASFLVMLSTQSARSTWIWPTMMECVICIRAWRLLELGRLIVWKDVVTGKLVWFGQNPTGLRESKLGEAIVNHDIFGFSFGTTARFSPNLFFCQ